VFGRLLPPVGRLPVRMEEPNPSAGPVESPDYLFHRRVLVGRDREGHAQLVAGVENIIRVAGRVAPQVRKPLAAGFEQPVNRQQLFLQQGTETRYLSLSGRRWRLPRRHCRL